MPPEIIIAAAAGGIIVGVATFVLLMLQFRKSSMAQRTKPLSSDQARDVEDLIRQLELLIQDIDARLDDRLAHLDAALDQADAKTAQLRQACAANQSLAAPSQASQAERKVAPPAPQTGSPASEDEVVTLPGTWPLPPERLEATDAQAVPSGMQPCLPSEAGQPLNTAKLQSPRHSQILALRGQGLTTVDIARKLQMDIGEVELVLNLHRAGRG